MQWCYFSIFTHRTLKNSNLYPNYLLTSLCYWNYMRTTCEYGIAPLSDSLTIEGSSLQCHQQMKVALSSRRICTKLLVSLWTWRTWQGWGEATLPLNF